MIRLPLTTLFVVLFIAVGSASADSELDNKWRQILGTEEYSRVQGLSKNVLAEMDKLGVRRNSFGDAVVIAEYERVSRWLRRGQLSKEAEREALALLQVLQPRFLSAARRSIIRSQDLFKVARTTKSVTESRLLIVGKALNDMELLRASLEAERSILPGLNATDKELAETFDYESGTNNSIEMLKNKKVADDKAAKAIERFEEKYFELQERELKEREKGQR